MSPSEPSTGPALPDVQMHLHRPNEPAVGRVVRSERCTHGRRPASFVRHIEIDVSDTELAGNFRAGQSFGVVPPGEDDKGRPHKVRLYSIASPTGGEDGEGRVLATTVKRTIDEHEDDHSLFLGVASNHLCDLQEGDEVAVTGPNGKRFLLPAEPDKYNYLFLATGTGIAPFRGMLMELLGSGSKPGTLGAQANAALVMGTPYATDLLYHDDLQSMASGDDRFSYHTAISREAGEGRMYVSDRLLAEREAIGGWLENENTLVYICGIAGMEMGIFRALSEMLPGDALEPLLRVDEDVRGDPESWTRRMLHKQVRPTRNVFLEVY